MSTPSKLDRALGGRLEVEDRPAEGGLAAAGLADQAVGLAACGSAGRRRRRRRRSRSILSKMTPRLIGKCTLTPLTSTRTSRSRRRWWRSVIGSPPRGCGSAGPGGPSSTSSGSCSTQTSIGCEQRGANAHAWSHGRLSDTEPGIGVSRSPRGASSRGIEPSRPVGVRVARVGEERVAVAALDDAAGVEHVDLVAQPGDDAEVVGDHDQRGAGAPATSSLSSARICAWMVTSSAVVGSSAMSSRGWQASAIAISARCRMPPDSWCG